MLWILDLISFRNVQCWSFRNLECGNLISRNLKTPVSLWVDGTSQICALIKQIWLRKNLKKKKSNNIIWSSLVSVALNNQSSFCWNCSMEMIMISRYYYQLLEDYLAKSLANSSTKLRLIDIKQLRLDALA